MSGRRPSFLAGARARAAAPLTLGLVNNMPDAALSATERQFAALLAAAGVAVELKFLFLADVERGEAARAILDERYADAETLPTAGLDGLIVTGAEPKAAELSQEPYWRQLTAVMDWSEAQAVPVLWSCLAAHACVLHRDGVRRRPLAAKCSGVFPVEGAGEHPLLAGAPRKMVMPHSRWNALAETDLAAAGHHILTRSAEAGVDAFAKGPALFFQGHPEYDADSLMREYCRDAGRFLRGERDIHPALPAGSLDAATARLFEDLAEAAKADRRPERLGDYLKLLRQTKLGQPWRPTAISIVGNWLGAIAARKAGRLEAAFAAETAPLAEPRPV
jgi:homoserine O-succinyltransferase